MSTPKKGDFAALVMRHNAWHLCGTQRHDASVTTIDPAVVVRVQKDGVVLYALLRDERSCQYIKGIPKSFVSATVGRRSQPKPPMFTNHDSDQVLTCTGVDMPALFAAVQRGEWESDDDTGALRAFLNKYRTALTYSNA